MQYIVLGLQQQRQNLAAQLHRFTAQLNLVSLYLDFWVLSPNHIGKISQIAMVRASTMLF